MAAKQVLVPLAPGFEEIEAVTVIDVLRRAGVAVITAGLEAGPVAGSHEITVLPDETLDQVDAGALDMVVLPGGMPGATHLKEDPRLQEILRAVTARGGWTAAICAAPMALGPAGITEGRTVTSYPGFGDRFAHGTYVEDRVVVDGPVITSRGPGTALEFALTLVAKLVGPADAENLAAGMLVQPGAPPREVWNGP